MSTAAPNSLLLRNPLALPLAVPATAAAEDPAPVAAATDASVQGPLALMDRPIVDSLQALAEAVTQALAPHKITALGTLQRGLAGIPRSLIVLACLVLVWILSKALGTLVQLAVLLLAAQLALKALSAWITRTNTSA